jgi:alanine racemase
VTIADVPLRPTFCEVDLDAITKNLEAIRAHVDGATVMPVIKADAYGHGLLSVGLHLQAVGAVVLGVAYVEEGVSLRDAGVSIPIHVLGGAVAEQIPAFIDHELDLTIPSMDKLYEVAEVARRRGVVARVHLKIDTGMERIGVHHYNAEAFLTEAARSTDIDVVSVFSHFANADVADLRHARLQLERFLEATAIYDRLDVAQPSLHMANSAAIEQLPEAHLDLVRPGLLLFGVRPDPDIVPVVGVVPALAWKSRVIYFKVVEEGAPVGYGSTWTPEDQTRVVTLPVGYGDGYRRSASNTASVVLRGALHPVRGRVCMDQTMVDIGWGSAYNGDEVVLIGTGDNGCAVTAEQLAVWCDTIPYEILTSITARVPRVYLGGM